VTDVRDGTPWASQQVRMRIDELQTRFGAVGAGDVGAVVARSQRRHLDRLSRGVMLSAATNLMSPAVSALHEGALSTRPSMGWPGDKEQTAVQELEELEVLAVSQVAGSMRARFAEVRFSSATIANLAAYIAFTDPGDTVAVLSPEAGGHNSHQQGLGAAGIRGLDVVHLPYVPERLDVDADALRTFVDTTRPRLIVVGGSVPLFPHDLAPVRVAADRVGAVVMYDASHTAGLIAAGHFQQPLDEGADVMTFSTYKTFAGPAGGAAVTRSVERARRMSLAAYPILTSNYDASRLGPLAMAAAEAVEQRPEWAAATIACAAGLATHLHARGHAVVGADRGFTRSHQAVIDVTSRGDAKTLVLGLEAAGIYAGACRVPWQQPESSPGGIRFGLQEFVRRGGTPELTPLLADVIDRALSGTAPEELWPATSQIVDCLSTDLWGRRTAHAAGSLSATTR
jgi:glycine hydroxymethyltransferase